MLLQVQHQRLNAVVLRILVLTVSYPTDVGYYADWIEAFETHSRIATGANFA